MMWIIILDFNSRYIEKSYFQSVDLDRADELGKVGERQRKSKRVQQRDIEREIDRYKERILSVQSLCLPCDTHNLCASDWVRGEIINLLFPLWIFFVSLSIWVLSLLSLILLCKDMYTNAKIIVQVPSQGQVIDYVIQWKVVIYCSIEGHLQALHFGKALMLFFRVAPLQG